MRDLLAVAMILSVGFLTGELILTYVPHTDESYPPRVEFNWSQQTLRSPGEASCIASGHIPLRADDIFLECLPERGSTDAIKNPALLERSVNRSRDRLERTRDVNPYGEH